MLAVWGTAFLSWSRSQRMKSQMQYSLATKNLGLVYREDKGEAAVLQNTLLRTEHARRTPPLHWETVPYNTAEETWLE